MTRRDYKWVIEVLKGRSADLYAEPDWFAVYGFAEFHKVAGYLSGRLGTKAPAPIRQMFENKRREQARRVAALRREIERIENALCEAGVRHAFLKGSLLSNANAGAGYLYDDGERTSNDIDLLIRPADISAAGQVLEKMGFCQGRWNSENNKVEPFSRLEILTRRMNRGETAPYLMEGTEIPFVEVDLNFSMGFLPTGDAELVEECLANTKIYNGRIEFHALATEENILQLLLHQYKESAVYSMACRGKAYQLYKLLDIYKLLEERSWSRARLERLVLRHNLQKECCIVLGQVAELFESLAAKELAEEIFPTRFSEEVLDPPNGKTYGWTIPLKERPLHSDGRFLEEKQ